MSYSILNSLSSSNHIRKELLHGDVFRTYEINSAKRPVHPTSSPVDVSYFVQRKRRIERVEEKIHLSKSTSNEIGGSKKKKFTCKSMPIIKNSFWERVKLTHKQYTDVLSTPHLHCSGDDDVKKYRSKTATDICSPRIIQMSNPTKRRILAVWQDFGNSLPVDAVHRLHNMIYNDQNVAVKEARHYFKICDKKRRRLKRKMKLLKRKKKNFLKKNWLKCQARETSKAILDYFSAEPKLDLSFKQLLLSDVMLNVLTKVLKKQDPILRYTRNPYNRELVRLVDKLAVWIDNVSKIVDQESLEEEEVEEESEDVEKTSKIASEIISTAASLGEIAGLGKEGLAERHRQASDREDEDEIELIRQNSLERLIQLLAQSSSTYLSSPVDELENTTRNELLSKLKILNRGYENTNKPADVLKKVLKEWVLHNDSSKLDDDLNEQIERVAEKLAVILAAEIVYGMFEKQPKEKGVSEDEDESFEPGTVTEIMAPDGTVQIGVVDDDGEVMPVQMTPSGNLLPTVYDKIGKVVDKLFDPDGNRLEVTFNKLGVPEPDSYDGELFDKNRNAHELIFNKKGKRIPQCYDKDGNPIPADYDENNEPIYYGPNGIPISEEDLERTVIIEQNKTENEKQAEDEDEPVDVKKEIQDGENVEDAIKKEKDEVKVKEEEKREIENEEPQKVKEEPLEEGKVAPSEVVKEEPSVVVKIEPSSEIELKEEQSEGVKEEPSGVVKEETSEVVKEEPSGVMVKEEPSGVVEEEPSEVVKVEPSVVVKEEPSEVMAKEEPSAVVEKEPSEVIKEKPSVDVKEEPSEVVKEDMSIAVKEEPSEVVKDEPSIVVEEEPSATVKEEEKEKGEETTEEKEKEEEIATEMKEKEIANDEQEAAKVKEEEKVVMKEEETKAIKEEVKMDMEEKLQDKKEESEKESRGDQLEKDERKEDDEIVAKLKGDQLEGRKSDEETLKEKEEFEKDKLKEQKLKEKEILKEKKSEDKKKLKEAKEMKMKKEQGLKEKEKIKQEDEEEEEEEEEEETDEEEREELEFTKESDISLISSTTSRESMIRVIKGHKPKRIYEHSKDTICCLSLKIWAVWVLEIIHNAHNWTKWISNTIEQIKTSAAILRGQVLLPNGQKKVLFREDWNNFMKQMNEDVIAWRQYSKHVQDLSRKIIDKFHGKKVNCCEKCLEDHLIKNVLTAHETLRALTEALNCAGYWQRCLDEIVEATRKLGKVRIENIEMSSSEGETGWSYSSDDM